MPRAADVDNFADTVLVQAARLASPREDEQGPARNTLQPKHYQRGMATRSRKGAVHTTRSGVSAIHERATLRLAAV